MVNTPRQSHKTNLPESSDASEKNNPHLKKDISSLIAGIIASSKGDDSFLSLIKKDFQGLFSQLSFMQKELFIDFIEKLISLEKSGKISNEGLLHNILEQGIYYSDDMLAFVKILLPTTGKHSNLETVLQQDTHKILHILHTLSTKEALKDASNFS